MKEWITAAEAARMLSISIASVRNWAKAGRLRGVRSGRTLVFDRAEVEALKEALDSGRAARLRSRRNKTAADGAFVPAGYVRTKAYERLARQAAEIAADRLDPRLALLELALKLLIGRGHLEAPPEAGEAGLAERFLEGRLDAGGFAPLLRELCGIGGAGETGAAAGAERIGTADAADGRDAADTASAADERDAAGTASAADGPARASEGRPADARARGLPPLDADARRRLRELARLSVPYVEGDDLLGLVHLSLARLRLRKATGAYYTPSAIVESLVDEALAAWPEDAGPPRVIDPCCGSGNILIRVCLALKRRLMARGLAAREADRLLRERGALTGFDIDGTAVLLARLNLALLAEPDGRGGLPPEFPILRRDALRDAASQPAGSPESGPYDLVIGNPPWGFRFPPEESELIKRRFRTAAVFGAESFGLFIEAGLAMLRDGGVLAYVLPESLLTVDRHAEARRLIAEQTEMLGITLAGSPFAGVSSQAVTLTLRKRPPGHGHAVAVRDGRAGGRAEPIAQRRFRANPGFAFNVRATSAEHAILERMRTAPGVWHLKDRCDFALGIVTGDNRAHVREFPDGRVPEGWEPVLRGADVSAYRVRHTGRYILFTPERFQQTAPEPLYRAPEKLIYRFICADLVFAWDDRQLLTLNSANIIIPRAPGYRMKYVLAALNSRPVRFYHTRAHGSVKVLRRHIEALPLPACPPEEQERIAALADELIACEDPAGRLELYEAIDRRVMALYGFDADEQRLVAARIGPPAAPRPRP
jgi:excisionase family DNA binding protein